MRKLSTTTAIVLIFVLFMVGIGVSSLLYDLSDSLPEIAISWQVKIGLTAAIYLLALFLYTNHRFEPLLWFKGLVVILIFWILLALGNGLIFYFFFNRLEQAFLDSFRNAFFDYTPTFIFQVVLSPCLAYPVLIQALKPEEALKIHNEPEFERVTEPDFDVSEGIGMPDITNIPDEILPPDDLWDSEPFIGEDGLVGELKQSELIRDEFGDSATDDETEGNDLTEIEENGIEEDVKIAEIPDIDISFGEMSTDETVAEIGEEASPESEPESLPSPDDVPDDIARIMEQLEELPEETEKPPEPEATGASATEKIPETETIVELPEPEPEPESLPSPDDVPDDIARIMEKLEDLPEETEKPPELEATGASATEKIPETETIVELPEPEPESESLPSPDDVPDDIARIMEQLEELPEETEKPPEPEATGASATEKIPETETIVELPEPEAEPESLPSPDDVPDDIARIMEQLEELPEETEKPPEPEATGASATEKIPETETIVELPEPEPEPESLPSPDDVPDDIARIMEQLEELPEETEKPPELEATGASATEKIPETETIVELPEPEPEPESLPSPDDVPDDIARIMEQLEELPEEDEKPPELEAIPESPPHKKQYVPMDEIEEEEELPDNLEPDLGSLLASLGVELEEPEELQSEKTVMREQEEKPADKSSDETENLPSFSFGNGAGFGQPSKPKKMDEGALADILNDLDSFGESKKKDRAGKQNLTEEELTKALSESGSEKKAKKTRKIEPQEKGKLAKDPSDKIRLSVRKIIKYNMDRESGAVLDKLIRKGSDSILKIPLRMIIDQLPNGAVEMTVDYIYNQVPIELVNFVTAQQGTDIMELEVALPMEDIAPQVEPSLLESSEGEEKRDSSWIDSGDDKLPSFG